ncbi:PREDICTED: rhythmically expressed gene 5 protein [Bactrocera latifrons]|uniref:Rhythmically expressed gene 5 protein n=1 Tax=Bactrocera latifrons TaxID=174628 RepID=A0A0K8UCM7_BACLA|nr:PREDICTED: rhythmically expressed gene 5 protein [Bactrocera latifrons]
MSNLNNNNKRAAAKVIATCLILSVSMQMCCGSAIPIWEFLTRNEKMSYLYSTFGQLVSVHCKATAASTAKPVNECKRDLLAYGYEKLQTFSDAQLDLLDPYQRAANELIWSSIMRNHPSSTLITTRKPLPTPPDSSLIILTHQKPANTAGSINTHSQNPLFDGEADNKHKFAMDMDITYGYANGQIDNQKSSTETFLSGPLVFRVRPDGSPVEEDQHKPLPRDDDLEAYQLADTTVVDGAADAANSGAQATTVVGAQPKHRKIAMISDLKQQHLASMALQRDLQPPYEPARLRRQPEQSVATAGRAIPLTQSFHGLPFAGYYYAKGQA